MADVMCYNRGCGKTYNPRKNAEDSTDCRYHSGAPYFHETYKGWTCCGKKSVDFTEFLNFPGCTRGPHSRQKPVEPESISGRKDDRPLAEQMAEHQQQRKTPEPTLPTVERPDFDSAPLVELIAHRSASLVVAPHPSPVVDGSGVDGSVKEGESCKNAACKMTYANGEATGDCVHHPGVPIFHEGMKYWSCCQRKTTDFESFLSQEGCAVGKHKWKKDKEGTSVVQCRYDWHQTASHVTLAVYAKKYDPDASWLKISPVRAKLHVYFPESAGSFDLDLELGGIIDVDGSSATMAGTKLELKMKKAVPGSWGKLNLFRPVKQEIPVTETGPESEKDTRVDALSLDDLELGWKRPVLSNEASGGRTGVDIL